jgi:hypothetical protein
MGNNNNCDWAVDIAVPLHFCVPVVGDMHTARRPSPPPPDLDHSRPRCDETPADA